MDTRSIPRPSQQKRGGLRSNAGNGPLPDRTWTIRSKTSADDFEGKR
jgi:hypothetical protein